MKTYRRNGGAAILIVVLFFVILSITLLTGVSGPVGSQIRNTVDFLNSKQSYSVADAQAENTLYRFNKGKSDAPSVLSLLGATATATVVDVGGDKQVSVQGTLGEFQRFVKTTLKLDTGVAFNYGLQVGVGGITMTGSSHIIGNVYSNGDVVGNGNQSGAQTYVTGSLTVANGANPVTHIDNTGSTTPAFEQSFGMVAANQDIAQSFVISTSSPISEIQIYVKKTGLPANATVKIVNNVSSAPGTTVLTSGTLNSTLVTSSYSYVPVTITTNVALSSGSTYWIVIDMPGNDAAKYYTLGLNDSAYASGEAKIGTFGGTLTNIATSTADAYFKVLVGGDPGSITAMQVGTTGGTAWARNATYVQASGALYCQVDTLNSKPCDTSRADPSVTPMPISSGNIAEWKSEGTAGGSTSSVSIGGSSIRTMGPMKINGDLTISGSGKLYVTGTLYVTGNISTSGSGKIIVDSSLGAGSVVIVNDGTISLSGSGVVAGSGTAGSYMVIASTNTGTDAITVSGDAGSVILAAIDGTVTFSGSAKAKSVVAKRMVMNGNVELSYDTGLADLSFSSGPSGGWGIDSWKEVPGL